MNDQNIYKFELIVENDNFIVHDHRVYGVRILPGVTLLDMTYRFGKKFLGHTAFTLDRVLFKRPIATHETFDQKLRVLFESRSDQDWQVQVQSQKVKAGQVVEPTWVEIMQCRLSLPTAQPIARPTFDLQGFIETASRQWDVRQIYEQARAVEIWHGSFMKTLGTVYQRENERLVVLHLSEVAEEFRDQFYAHPAFLDGATFAGWPADDLGTGISSNNTPYIPFTIRRFGIYQPFPQTIYVYAHAPEPDRATEGRPDLVTSNIIIYDGTGQVIAEFNDLTAKRIREVRLIRALVRQELAGGGNAPEPPGPTLSPSDPTPAAWDAADEQPTLSVTPEVHADNGTVKAAITGYLQQQIANTLSLNAAEIDPHLPFYELGLESTELLVLTTALETHYGLELYPTLLFEYPTIAELTDYLWQAGASSVIRPVSAGNIGDRSAMLAFAPSTEMRQPPPASSQTKISSEIRGAKQGSIDTDNEAIAIIGLSGRYPQAETVAEFWENLKAGRNCITEIPPERWDYRPYYDPNKDKSGKSYSKWGGFIDDVDKFDPLFFNISPREAERMDPQERLFLETVWATVEDAGYSRSTLANIRQVGIFVGVMYHHYPFVANDPMAAATLSISSYWQIANRVSYVFNLQGPSLAIDTACSSALTAIYLACESIKRGECRLAIAGGVNLSLHPAKWVALSEAQLIGSNAQSKSLGAGDGYLPGEGVGAVLLKPLDQAVADNDQIYAVIKGGALNHSGKTSGFTVPNPNAQADLIRDTFEKTGVDPETITYIEVAANGSAMGDPIEIAGLSKAFQPATHRKGQWCPIGSVKSNIGHLEAASGISQLTKVILQLKHKTLVPSINAEPVNPNLQLERTPFYIQKEAHVWKRPEIEQGDELVEIPRRAAISSFGVGGANAHLVVEEYQGLGVRSQALKDGPHLIVLSARNEERLKAYAQKLLAFLEQAPALSLASLAYTLQVGREAMKARLALVVASVEALVERLRQFEQQQTGVEGLYRGHQKTTHLKPASLIEGKAGEAFIRVAMAERDFDRLAQLWVSGVEIAWDLLYGAEKPGRISLPTYPFAKKRCWLPSNGQWTMDNGQFSILHSSFSIEVLHPLVHRNISDLEEQRFSTTFSGTEFFLTDHQVQGEKVLPGVAYLEMARAAGEMAVRDGTVTQIKDVVWLRPMVVKAEAVEIQLGLYPSKRDEIGFEISSSGLVHSQGKLVVGQVSRPEALDIAAIEARCGSRLEGVDCYRRFREQGLWYGPAFQGVTHVRYNQREALARLQLPAVADGKGYGLHPSVLDAALQATIGLMMSQSGSGSAPVYLPFAVQTVTIYQTLPEKAYAYVQYSDGNEPAGTKLKYDITVTDEHGAICVALKAFTIRARSEPATNEVLYGVPSWQVKPLVDRDNGGGVEPGVITLLLVGLGPDVVETIAKTFNQAEVMELNPANATALIHHAWQQLKAIIDQKPKTAHHVLVVAADTVERHRVAPLAGLLKTARLEQPYIRGKVITVSNPETSQLMSLLGREMRANTFADVDIRYDEAGTRSVKTLREIEATDRAKPAYLKPGGVYWITGGLGGLGRIFARHLLDQGETITIILSGRSDLDEAGRQHLADLNRKGGTVAYLPVDVSVQVEVERVVQAIKEQYGPLNGIIHSAGVISDSFIINKTAAEIEPVLAPKVSGLLNIDVATRTEALDFVVLFSSLVGVLGNLGQADYAAANAFLDDFARHRQTLVESGQRSGRTVSINWPLWAEGGMSLAPHTEKWVANRTGLKPLSTEQGLKAFDLMLAQDEYDQLLVAPGDLAKIRQSLGLIPVHRPHHRPGSVDSQVSEEVKEQVENALIELCMTLLKVDQADLDTATNLAEYGVDSILMIHMLSQLEERFGTIVAPTAIADYPTIRALTSYLLSEGAGVNGSASDNEVNAHQLNGGRSTFAAGASAFTSKQKKRFRDETGPRGSGKVAILAQACRLPQSPSLERLWDNLATGRDLITTVPPDRWQAEALYSAEPGQPDKTYTNHGAFIEGIGYFDADYFGVSAEEAITMDPQQRIMLELAQELWDRAGYRAEEIAGSNTGIFIGAKDNNYVRNYYHLIPPAAVQHTLVNTISNMIAARVSDFYNLTGAAQVIDTACSSSLVAVHDACRTILSGESELAIAGGIFLMVDAFTHVGFSQARVLSAEGRSHVFDERANGFVLGEGGGLVLLKEYEAALRDGDQILGVILGSAVNNDGHTMGLTVPNQTGQKAVIETALRHSQVNPAEIGYLEAHGTGTLLGDPIEIRAATEVYRQYTSETQYCAVGSVKSNLGHTMMAAGITGLIKLVLSLEHQQIPATLHCEKPHPRFKFEDSPFYPNTRLRAWEPRNGRRIGAISSFGFGGTNCHLIVEEGRQTQPIRQPLPLTQFNRKRYWLGQEITSETLDDFDDDYYGTLIEQFQNGNLSKSAFRALLVSQGSETR